MYNKIVSKITTYSKRIKILILIATTSLITLSGVAVAQNGGWFTFIPTLDLTTPGLELDSPFILSSLPEYFQISVTMSGSGTTEMPHQVSIIIEHNRVEEGPWRATAFYILALEDTNGTVVEEIDSGSFTDLREYDSYEKPLTWTPSVAASGYQMVLDITEVSWALVAEYTITATASPGGSIYPSGAITVLDGLSKEFAINPDLGYMIDDVLVDGASVVSNSSYLFENVQADHTIHANFIAIPDEGPEFLLQAGTLSDVESYSGNYSVHLETTGALPTAPDWLAAEARIVISMPEGFTLGELETLSWWEYLVAGYPPHVDVYLDAGDELVFEYACNNDMTGSGAGYYGTETGAWFPTFNDNPSGLSQIAGTAKAWANSGPSGGPDQVTYTTDATYTIDSESIVTKLEIEVDNWMVQTEAYVDDIELNGVTYDCEGEEGPEILLQNGAFGIAEMRSNETRGNYVFLSDGGVGLLDDSYVLRADFGMGRVVVKGVDTLLSAIEPLSYDFYYTFPDSIIYPDFQAFPYMVLECDSDGLGDVADLWIVLISTQIEYDAKTGGPMPTLETWMTWTLAGYDNWYDAGPGATGNVSAPTDGASLAAMQTTYPDAMVLNVNVAVGQWAKGNYEAITGCVDDIEIDGVIYDLEPTA